MLLDLPPELGHVLPAMGLRQHDRHLPGPVAVEREHRADLGQHGLRRRVIHLVDRDHVGDLHDPGLQRLDRVARAGHQHEHDGVGDTDHLDLALPGADRLDEDHVLAGCVEDQHGLEGRLGDAAQMAAGSHRADEDARIEEVIGQPDPVAEKRPLRERARGVDRDDASRSFEAAHVAEERADQARLADSGRAGDPDRVGASGLGVQVADEVVGERVGALDQRDRPGERPPIAGPDTCGERLARPVPPFRAHDGAGSGMAAAGSRRSSA